MCGGLGRARGGVSRRFCRPLRLAPSTLARLTPRWPAYPRPDRLASGLGWCRWLLLVLVGAGACFWSWLVPVVAHAYLAGRLADGWMFSTAVVSDEVLFVTRRKNPKEKTLTQQMCVATRTTRPALAAAAVTRRNWHSGPDARAAVVNTVFMTAHASPLQTPMHGT